MSDIAIRFDGLLFCLIILASIALLLIAVLMFAAKARWGAGDPRRSGAIARACAIGLGFCLLSLVALMLYMDAVPSPAAGPDWLDWIALPWAAILLGGLVRHARKRAG